MTSVGREFRRAVRFASEVHEGQTRKGTDAPYLAHLLEVAAIVLGHGGREREAVAALLHDAIEDAGVTEQEIAKQFGRKVARIVAACSDLDDGYDGHDGHRTPAARRDASTWQARKRRSLAHLRDPDLPRGALPVRAADALANARAVVADLRRISPETWLRFHAGATDQLWYYRSLTLELGRRLPGALTDELRATVGEMERIAGWWHDVGDGQEAVTRSDG